jgi:hypothetical protein
MEILGFLVQLGVMLLDPIGWGLTIFIVSLMWGHTRNRLIILASTLVSACALEALMAAISGPNRGFWLIHYVIAQAIEAALFVGFIELLVSAFRRRN